MSRDLLKSFTSFWETFFITTWLSQVHKCTYFYQCHGSATSEVQYIIHISQHTKVFHPLYFIFPGALWLGAILYIWQFPHFKALSWNIKNDYQRAGYQMSSVTNPDMCKRVAFRHTLFMTAACCLGPVVGATTHMFTLYSLPCNIYGVYLGWRFYNDGDSSSSRNLFRFSLLQIPYLLAMMLVSKNWQQADNKSASDSPSAEIAT